MEITFNQKKFFKVISNLSYFLFPPYGKILSLHHLKSRGTRDERFMDFDLPTSAGMTQVGEDSRVPRKCLNSIHRVYPDKRKMGWNVHS